MTYNGCKKAFFDFGTIPTGNVSYKYMNITNDSLDKQEYEIRRDPATNPIDYVFEVQPYTASVDPGASFVFKIKYEPSVPFTINFDYFNVLDKYGVCLKFGVKGKSLGPGVLTSTRRLIFMCTGCIKKASKTIELKNESSVVAKYHFEIDEKQSVFTVDNSHGIINPNSYIYVKISFDPACPGVYVKNVYCLIHYQHPITIDVVGICSYNDVLQNAIMLKQFPQPELTKGYERYISDSLSITGHSPPLVLSVSHIDFGQTDVEGTQYIPSTVSVTNHIKMNVLIVWDKDVEDVFKINPNSTLIPSEESALFEVYFRPSNLDRVYARELDARVYWGEHSKILKNGEEIHVPIPLSLKLMGHSFPRDSYGWMPQYEVQPETIVLPACVPPIPVYSTFIVKRYGHLPLMFKFSPPQITNYVVKPMQGVITKDYQIIVVQMCSDSKKESAYIERWGLQFNGSPQNEILIEFRAYAEYPMVHIGQQNTVILPPTFLLTEQSTNICMKNCTRHCIRYTFIIPKNMNCVKLTHSSGIIASNEIIYILWHFIPRFTGDHSMNIKCQVTALKYCYYPIGMPVDTWITAHGLSEDTNLVALPSEMNCGGLVCGEIQEKCFYLFNFGHCKVHFKLKCTEDSSTEDVHRTKNVILFPESGTVESGGNTEIKVTIQSSESESTNIDISYAVRLNLSSNEVISKPYRPVVNLHYYGILPTLQIYDMKLAGGGPIFSKVCLWKMMNINMINQMLNTQPTNSVGKVTLYLPHAPLHNNYLDIILLLRNQSEADTVWSLKRRKMCTCKLITENKGISFRALHYHCPHRPLFSIHPTNGVLHPHEEDVLILTVRYDVLGVSELSYVLQLSNNRQIVLTAQIVALPMDNSAPSAFTSAMSLKNIFIGDQFPVTQLYWLYNNTQGPAKYEVDVTPLTDITEHFCNIDVLTCLNPSGIIPPKKSEPLIFKFKPIALQKCEVTLPLYLQPNWYDLKITGDGVLTCDNYLYAMRCKVPEIRRFEHCEVPIDLSVDHIVVDPFPTHTKVERLFFLQNFSKTMVTGYVWHMNKVPDILRCTVNPNKGTLQPGEKHACKLILESENLACLLTVQVTCELLNMTERRNYEKSVIMYQDLRNRLKDEFTITEEGITKPVVTMKILPYPTPFHQVLAVTCYIYDHRDVDRKMNLRDQLKQTPAPEINILEFKDLPQLTLYELRCTKDILEMLIWDVVNSLWFKSNLQHLKKESNHFYCQFMMDENERDSLNDMSYVVPPRQLTESILNDIIVELVLDEFN